ncbi:polysaccharide deacetylase family protein [Streptomyces sp. RB6PN25]|uniref:Polysaccharide deacetylase family protein n=1 Tax=Streptomyces humicola TaxID=2953240 RepID=A0ABT1PTQ5_9ACTN|nr:polysaccharide deacetylase family protein [Streptomyces humicola]MCQ4081059.1 polysaccharide deacetylase family protein [Streptomyces humicola]
MKVTGNPQVTRRALMSLGGLVLLSACAAHASTPPPTSASKTPQPTTVPGDSHPSPPPPSDPPDAAPAGKPEFYVHRGPHAIALTIDDGPHPEWTPQVLDLLRRYGITATFCQVGAQVSAYPGLVRAVAAEGHLIANHTWTHADLARASAATVRSQLERTSDEIEKVSGHRPALYRAPYGAWSKQTLSTCRELDMRPLDWSVDPRDWSRPGTSRIVERIMAHTHPGSIILEHDGGGDRSQTVAALRVVLPRLIDAGYQFVTP